jgi:hypothetical protein
MSRGHRIAAVSGVLALTCCAPQPETPDPADLQEARQAAFAFDVRMRQEIIARLDRNEDPVAVYLAYADHVPLWAREISDSLKFDFSRTSLGPLNAAAAPDAWETEQMDRFNFYADAGYDIATLEAAEIREEGDARVFRWMRPIVMTEPCLVCHGEKLEDRIRLLLAQEYPSEEPGWYFEGQIGGAYSVRKVLSVNGKPPPPYVSAPLPPRLPADERGPNDAPLVQPRPAEPEPPPVEELPPVEEPPVEPL